MRFMKTRLLPLVLLLLSSVAAGQTLPPAATQFFQTNGKPYFIVFYVKGENYSRERSKEETDRLLLGHLGYLRKQVEAGKYALTGPIMDDGHVRGIVAMEAASAEEARQILSGDPMIQSGQFAIEIHPGILTDLSAVKATYPTVR